MARPYGDIFSGFTGILKSWKRDNKTTLKPSTFEVVTCTFILFLLPTAFLKIAVQIIYVQTIFTYLGCLNKPPFKKIFLLKWASLFAITFLKSEQLTNQPHFLSVYRLINHATRRKLFNLSLAQ